MKIVHVETGRHFYGGAQQVIWLLQGLEVRGIDNLLVCTRHSAIESVAAAAGIPVTTLPCAGELDLAFVWRLRRVLTREAPDLVHCHSRRGADFLGGQAASMVGLPAIVTRRVDNTEPALMSALRYRRFARVVAISENIAEVLRQAGVDDERLVVIRSAVDASQIGQQRDREFLEREFAIDLDTFAIAIVAQLIPRKGHRYLLEALASLKGRYPRLRLEVFGSGVLDEALRRLVAALGLNGMVHFAGYRDDLDDFLSGFDLLVHPAVREGLGVAMLKASAAGLPVIAFDVAGAREIVENGQTGLLVPSEDSGALAAAIARLIEDTALRRRMGANGRARMQRDFSIDNMVNQYVKTYEAVLNVGK
ncbi:MAG TPA: glycosyltransferase [Woeseiaceae bacterium]|nr:glycosyltransferase [Woeseiaceae bacterium]